MRFPIFAILALAALSGCTPIAYGIMGATEPPAFCAQGYDGVGGYQVHAVCEAWAR